MTELLGHRRSIRQLWQAAATESLHHAYLFEGAPGVGKHTVAVRLAMLVNCRTDLDPAGANESERPCGTCPTCRAIAAGTHPDVIRLAPSADQAAGTITVEQVREVVRQTGYRRYEARFRMVIVDPAEAMLPSSANALLKTLEEPPPGTGFVLLTASASALLPTIVSRCQRVRFGAVEEAEIAAWLGRRGVDGATAERAAQLAGGCPGRALSLAEGGLAERDGLRARALVALAGDLPAIHAFSAEVAEGKRADWRATAEMLLAALEDLVRDAAVHGAGSTLPLANSDQPELATRWASALYPGGVERCARLIADCREDLRAFATGRTALDALLTGLATELGAARKGAAA